MNLWIGRIIGTLLGLLLANPFTAMIGFFLGYYFVDKPKIERMRRANQAAGAFNYRRGPSSAARIIELSYEFMGYVARGAGRVNESHIAKAQQFMDAMGLDQNGRQMAINAFNRGKSDGFNPAQEIANLRNLAGNNSDIIAFFIEVQIQIAIADGSLQTGEQQRLLEIGRYLGFAPNQIMRLIQVRFAEMEMERNWGSFYGRSQQGQQREYEYERTYQRQDESRRQSASSASGADLRHAYEILGVDENASFEEIKKAHKRLMLKYHPDRLASQGLPPEMIKLYTQKAQDIQAAFNLIKAHRKEE